MSPDFPPDFPPGTEAKLALHRKSVYLPAVGTSSSPLADDGLLLTSTSHARPKHGLETIMLFGTKSDLKNHLSAKHPTFSHKVMAKATRDHAFETDLQMKSLPERDPPPKAEGREVVDSQS